MGLFSTFGESLGHKGLTLTVTLECSEYHWSDEVRGIIEVRGGAIEQSGVRLSVRVVEHADGGKDFSSWNPYPSQEIGRDILLEAGAVRTFSFALRLPETGRPSGEGSVVRFLWCVEAEAHAAHVLGAYTALADFRLSSPPVSDAVKALRDALLSVAPVRLRAESQSGRKVRFDFAPVREAASALDGLTLVAEEVGGEVVGALLVNPQEHSLADYTRAFAHRDVQEYALRFPVSRLASGIDRPAPEEIRTALRGLLEPFLPADPA